MRSSLAGGGTRFVAGALARRRTYGHGTLRSGTDRARSCFNTVFEVLEDRTGLIVMPVVDVFDRVGREVVELPLIGERFGAVLLATQTVGREVTYAGFGPRRRIVERPNELPQVARTANGIRLLDACDDPLEVGADMRWHFDPQGCGRLDRSADPTGESRRPAVAFEHVVPGQDIHRAVAVRRERTVDHGHQIATRQRMHLAELGAQRLRGRRFVDARCAEQGRDQIDV